jgi:hypothetical protein
VRKRDIKIGMRVRHSGSGKDMGFVGGIGTAVVRGRYPNGDPWIAHPDELSPHPGSRPEDVEGPT